MAGEAIDVSVRPGARAIPSCAPHEAQVIHLAEPRRGTPEHLRRLYDRSATLALIGAWECDLIDDSLVWTDGVYDLFDLPRGGSVARDTILAMYDPESRAEMERLRARAIRLGEGFRMDARIVTARGEERWMRLITEVEWAGGRPSRLYGLKQDVTAEHAAIERLRRQAEQDALTGLGNRAAFDARFHDAAPVGALLLIDLDDFKQLNDGFGHLAGDAALARVGDAVAAAFSCALLHARIGGDEFAVLFAPETDAATIADAVSMLRADLDRGLDWAGEGLVLGASLGLAMAEAGTDASRNALFARADAALYAAKAARRGER